MRVEIRPPPFVVKAVGPSSEEGEMTRRIDLCLAPWPQAAVVLGVLLAAYVAPPMALAEGIPATVVTIKGESIEGRFLGATGAELTFDAGNRLLTLLLRDVSYISFVGRPPSAEASSYSKQASPASQLRVEGLKSETDGRLDEALRKYEEAAKLDPTDPLTVKALDRVRGKLRNQTGATKAAPYKILTKTLKDGRRYAEAAACYDEAVRLDPADGKFREEFQAMRHYWDPTTCPTDH